MDIGEHKFARGSYAWCLRKSDDLEPGGRAAAEGGAENGRDPERLSYSSSL
jgi:hypothetical protein